ncbi:hypothetical protein K7I13_07780 [Brucepastera parasyntrophica]|nr:hypothetical protein [Brucepastera parasyntrophica]ULQ58476.1 hypothetical protein K7I13_07780 [Brucepastera parasyntrophica]
MLVVKLKWERSAGAGIIRKLHLEPVCTDGAKVRQIESPADQVNICGI